MGLARAFDTISRTMMWETLCRKGLPISMINHIRRERKNTKPHAEENKQYGEK